MAEAESAIKALLELNTTSLNSATSVWALQAPQNAARPYLTFEVTDESPTEVMGGETTPTEAVFEVNIYAADFATIVAITNEIRGSLQRYSGSIGGVTVQDVFYLSRNDFFSESDRDYQRILDFRMFFEE